MPKEEGKYADQGPAKPAAHQIWLISPYGGEAWQLTKSETDIDGFQLGNIRFAHTYYRIRAAMVRKTP